MHLLALAFAGIVLSDPDANEIPGCGYIHVAAKKIF
jgi:hypothetical protein